MTLEDIFSVENVLDYSKICLDLAVEIPESERTPGREFDTLMIPSRGAVPFFLGMTYSLAKIGAYFGGDHQRFYEGLGLQPMISSLLPPEVNLPEQVEGKPYKVLLIPFTADLNIERFDKCSDNSEFTKNTRGYWARVTKAFFKDPKERRNDPYFRTFTDLILRDIEGRDALAEAYERFPKINKFSMIDTVISGRASTQILGAFEGLSALDQNPNLNPGAFLIIDENGEKLVPEFSRYLNRKRLEGKASLYQVPRIVSEDEGASLLGVGASIYPSVMRLSQDFCHGNETFFVGAGGWFNSSTLPGNYFENFKTFMNMIYKGIDYLYARDFSGERAEEEHGKFREAWTSFLQRGKETKILAQTSDDISALRLSAHYSYQNCYETRSHVLHAPFTPQSEERARHVIASMPGVRLKVKEQPKVESLHNPSPRNSKSH